MKCNDVFPPNINKYFIYEQKLGIIELNSSNKSTILILYNTS